MPTETKLQAVIDRLVESAIRRILPKVMNEILVRTLVDSGVLAEAVARPVRRRKGPKRRPVRTVEARETRPVRGPRPPRRMDLNEFLDDSVGADAYEQYESRTPRPVASPPESDDRESDPPVPQPAVARRLASLDPSLQAMAEGLVIPDDDGGEMWGEEHDSIPTGAGAISEVPDVVGAARRAGMDFSKMRQVIERTSAPKASDSEDAKARAAFENLRLKRMRERLNDGKPVLE